MIYVTHDQTEAMTMGDHIAVMSEGRILQLGSPMDVYSKPSCTFVARFIGSPPMNLWEASVKDDGRIHVSAGPALPPPQDLSGEIRDYVGKSLLAGVRPEGLVARTARPAGPCFEGKIEMLESTGSDVYLRISSAPGEFVVRSPDRAGPSLGEDVFVEVNPGTLHLFDAELGARVT